MTRGKAIERAWPYVTATAAAMFYLFVWRFRHSLPPNLRDVLAPVVSFGASTAGLAFDPRWNLAWYPYGITLWVFVISTALGVTIRVIRIFLLLLRLIASE